jgi:homoserine dehydrogenase
MSAVVADVLSVRATARPVRVALLGTGNVGGAVWQRLGSWAGTSRGSRLTVVHVANSRHSASARFGLDTTTSLADQSFRTTSSTAVETTLAGEGERVIVDATASEAIAERHADWLAQGIHVVTACKLGAGTQLSRWRAIRAACAKSGAFYGDSATVGAGLPLLRTLRDLRAGGDHIHAIAGVLSGSLAWLFGHYDGMRPFSTLVRQALAAGFTEPDPREDLSGEDVRRKLLILARTAGFELEADAVDVGSLVPPALAGMDAHGVDAGLPLLDASLRRRHAAAWKEGARLRHVARLDARGACVGLEALAPDDALAGGAGTDNRVAIWSDRYRAQPLVIQGPGAGAHVTAAALLDDVLRIACRGD